MTTFETPYGTVDAPSLDAAQKWMQRQKGDGGGPAAPAADGAWRCRAC